MAKGGFSEFISVSHNRPTWRCRDASVGRRLGDGHTRDSARSAARTVNRQQHHHDNTMKMRPRSQPVGAYPLRKSAAAPGLAATAMPLQRAAGIGAEVFVVLVGDILEIIGILRDKASCA